MKAFFLIGIAVIVSSSSFAQKSIFSKAKVNAASIYRNAAELQSTAEVNIPKGNSNVVISNIAENMDENSTRIGLGNNSITVLSSRFTSYLDSNYISPIANANLKMLQDSIQKIEFQISKVDIELEAYNKSIELLDKNQTVLVGSNTSNVAQLTQLTDYYTKKRIELSTTVQTIQKKKNDLTIKLASVKEGLKLQTSVDEKIPNGYIVLNIVNNGNPTNTRLDISYLTNNASWQPSYEIKGISTKEPLDVLLKANIHQTTGMDWKSVKLTLINGTPTRNNTAPILNPWFLNTTNNMKDAEVVVSAFSNIKKGKVTGATSEISADRLMNGRVAGVSVVNFNTNDNQLNTSYDVSTPYDILSNEEGNMVVLQQTKIPADYTYYTVLQFNTNAYLIAKIKDFSQYDLLDAKANVLFENMYIGETQIKPDETNNELNITLGSDKRISIKKEKVQDKSSDKFLSSYREKTITYDIIVRNNKKESVNMEIKDRFPLSTNNDIKIELLESSNASVDNEKGYLNWTVNIAPSETKKFRVSYKVRYPKDMNITNL